LLEDAFDAATLQQLDAELVPGDDQVKQFLAGAPDGRFSVAGLDTQTVAPHAVTRSEFARQLCASAVLTELARDLVGPDVRLYWDQSVYKKTAQKREFPWHQDNGYTFIEPQQYLTFWLPLVDVDEENGCPWIAPGLHRGGTLDHWATEIGLKCLEEAPDAVAVPARAGDAIVFSSLAPHRTGPNLKTGTVRKAYILQYSHDGSVATYRDGRTAVQNDPERQFRIL
jgi:ectoine hydroxylase-related dioxygenase (phytanoyl-CoA dioxygenase family)